MSNILLALPSEKLVLSAYAIFLGQTPGSSTLAKHVDYINSYGEAAYISYLNGIAKSIPVATLASSVLTNLGLTSVFTQAEAVAYLSAQPNNMAGLMLAASNAVLNYVSNPSFAKNAEMLAAQTAYHNALLNSYNYSSSSAEANISAVALSGLTGLFSAFTLTTGLDAGATFTGTAGNDTFTANIVQNSLGQQANTLGSGDNLKGGAGIDTLTAKISNGAYVGTDWPGMAIQPITSGIEVVKLEAQDAYVGDDDHIYLNAKDMTGVNTIGSWRSDADLVIQNLTTLSDAGTARNTSEMTVLMGYTGNSDSHWDESDLSVYFDQDYLLSGAASASTLELRIVNNYQLALNNTPLVAFVRVSFSVGTTVVIVQITDAMRALTGTAAYTALDAAIEAQLVTQGITGVTVTTLPARTVVFSDDVGGYTAGSVAGTYLPIQIVSTGAILTTGLVEIDNTTLNFNGLNTQTQISSTADLPVSINVNLEKVGLAGDGGELIVGSMFKDGGEWIQICGDGWWNDQWEYSENRWSDLYEGKGITQFDVTVSGGVDKPSSLEGMHSTGNNLRVVNVKTDAAQIGTFAGLQIGNSNTRGFEFLETRVEKVGDVITPTYNNSNALKDVQTFDASGFKGDLTLFAGLTREVTAKYMNLVDTAFPATADNVPFVYTGGSGNDYINLWLDSANLSDAGTTTREDFTLTINGGAGNDEIVTMIGGCEGEDGQGQGQGPNWYLNSKINGNLSINGETGNDTVRTLGTGDWKINAGAGDDTVYADNTGYNDTDGRWWDDNAFNNGKASWVFNAVNTDVDNLLSETATSVSAVNAQLTVTFMGFTKTVAIANSVGALANVTFSDLGINQAIKTAINLDPVLNKLLVAEDGPGRTLVVRSLIDGHMGDNWVDPVDFLQVAFSTTALTPAQTAPGLVLFSTASTLALLDGYNVPVKAPFGTDTGNTTDGADSTNVADNKIEGGTGNDVLVLGTGMYSNDTLVYKGLANGTDNIVNFDDTWYLASTPVFSAAPGVFERITVTFSASDGSPTAQTIMFDGFTVTLSAPTTSTSVIPAIDVANQFADQFNSANWSVFAYTPGSNVVTIQRDAQMDQTNIIPADFTGTYFGAANGNGTVAIVTTVEGVTPGVLGSPSSFVVTFDTSDTAAVAAGTFVFDGVTVAYALGDGSITLANKLAATAFTNWTVVKDIAALDPTVTFTAKVNGATAIGVDTDFDVDAGSTTDGVIGTVVGAPGTANTGTIITTIVPAGPGLGFDKIDFSAYLATGVVVTDSNQAAEVFGTANGVAAKWITMTESATNDGEYTINLVTSTLAGTADDVAVLIGVADFGYEQNFVTASFIL